MRNYETIFILDPSLSEDKATEEVDKMKSVVESAGGEIISIQRWGKRKLAYEINKRREGIYTLIKFRGDGTVISELERNFRIREAVIRFMTVIDTNPPSEGETEQAEPAPGEGAAAASPEGGAPQAAGPSAAPPRTVETPPVESADSSAEESPSEEPPAAMGGGSAIRE